MWRAVWRALWRAVWRAVWGAVWPSCVSWQCHTTDVATDVGMCLQAGIYMLSMWDTFAAGTAILFVVFWQAVAVGWFYGEHVQCSVWWT